MRARVTRTSFIAWMLAALVGFSAAATALPQRARSQGYAAGDARLSASERAGREIWFFATAFNDRFYTYSYAQRLGGGIDWFRILAARAKGDLFQGWGAIPD